jgi:hypothetical protein
LLAAGVALGFFFVLTLITGSICCPIRAIAEPSAGIADATNELADSIATAATTDKTIGLILPSLRCRHSLGSRSGC